MMVMGVNVRCDADFWLHDGGAVDEIDWMDRWIYAWLIIVFHTRAA